MDAKYLEEYMQRMLFLMDFHIERCIQNDMPICHITKGYFDYKNLNMCFVNDMVARMAEALYQGYLPIVEVPGGEGIDNLWSAFFKQPHEITGLDISSFWDRVNHVYEMEPVWGPGYKANLIPREKLCAENLYRELVVLNDDVNEYCEKEYAELIGEKKVLGVLFRGTDLGEAHPKDHPRQPSINQMINDVRKELESFEYSGIYLASDERKTEEEFRMAFPDEVILTNKRHYMSDYYNKENAKRDNDFLTDVMVKNHLDMFTYGLEYLSSLVLLSKCESLIAGNTLGSSAALFLNDKKYRKYTLYDLGFYGDGQD